MTTTVATTQLERFLELLGNTTGWSTITDIVTACDEAGFWSSDFNSRAKVTAKKMHIRKLIQRAKNERGFPLFFSVEVDQKDGKKVKQYKQESLFKVEDYKQVEAYHVKQETHHGRRSTSASAAWSGTVSSFIGSLATRSRQQNRRNQGRANSLLALANQSTELRHPAAPA